MNTTGNSIINTALLTATVFAALISSIANIIISIMNNHRLKRIEKEKQLNDIDKYRYSRLYELLLNWHTYDSEYSGDTAGEIAFNRMLNLFLDDSGRYSIARALLDKKYTIILDAKKDECNHLLSLLVESETVDGKHTEQFLSRRDDYFTAGSAFDDLLKDAINTQLETLLLMHQVKPKKDKEENKKRSFGFHKLFKKKREKEIPDQSGT